MLVTSLSSALLRPSASWPGRSPPRGGVRCVPRAACPACWSRISTETVIWTSRRVTVGSSALVPGVGHGEIGLVPRDGAAHDGVRLPLARLAQPEASLHRFPHRGGDLLGQRRLGRLVVERQDRDGLDRGRQAAAGETVAAAERENAKAYEKPRYQAQSRPAW